MTTRKPIPVPAKESNSGEIPKVVGVLSKDGKQLLISCPYCGKKHYHGSATYGHRLSHCIGQPSNPGYTIVPAPN
jgi:hypothetical protein